MKRRSVWVVLVASVMLLATSQTDLAFAGINALAIQSTPHSITSASWAAVAGVDQNVTSADRAGSAYPMTLTSQCSSPSAITRVRTGSWSSGTIITLTTPVAGLQVGYLVTGAGISNSYTLGSTPTSSTQRIKSFPSANQIELNSGSNTGTGILTFTISKRVSSVSDYALGAPSNDGRSIRVTNSDISDLEVGMTITGSNIADSGNNSIISIPTSSSRTFITATGTNTDSNQYLAFTPVQVCSSASSYFTLKNTGNITINSMSITQTGTALSGGNTITWYACSGTWNEASDTCSVTPTSILTTTSSSGAQQLTLALVPGAWARVQAVSTPAGASATLNISVSVSTSDLRAATNTNA